MATARTGDPHVADRVGAPGSALQLVPALAQGGREHVYWSIVRIRTLHTTVSLASGGTIRGGSFLSSALVAARLRRWFFTISTLPSLA